MTVPVGSFGEALERLGCGQVKKPNISGRFQTIPIKAFVFLVLEY
jgi:hypothetical protein